MNEGADRLLRRLTRAATRTQEIDIWRYLGSMTMDVVGISSFGVEFRTQDDEADASTSQEAQELITAAQTLFRLGGATASLYVPVVLLCPPLLPLVRLLAGVWPDAGMRAAVAARATLIRTCADLLRKVREADGAQADGVPSAKPAKRGVLPGSFLHHLAHARHHPTFRDGALLNDAEIISQAFSFLLGGYETTASSLGFTIYNLSANPDKAAKLTEELDAFGRERVPVNADLEHLPYTQACFKEALRLFPPGHITIREAVEDLNLAGHFIPKGTWLHVALCAIHRDPEVWDNPDAYVPERWVAGAPEEATDAQKKAWMPFGDGIRACVGKRFAWEEALIALIRIYQRFEFKLSPGQVPLAVQSPFVLGPARGIMVVPSLRREE